MPIQRTPNPSKKELLHRLTNIREKLSSLRQEEDKINQKLSHEYAQDLSKYLLDANAIEIDFNILLGGMLEIVSLAKGNSNRATPELSRRTEVWQKSGMMFQRNRKQESGSREQTNRQKSNEPEAKSSMQTPPPLSDSEEKTTHDESKNKPRARVPNAGDDKNANTKGQ